MKQNCTIPASSAYFGDPCPGTQKYLEVQYQCLPDMPKRRSQGSTGAFKQQTPPPIVIPRRGEHRNGIDVPVPTNHANDNKRNESSLEVNTSEKTRLFYPKHVYVVTEDETTKSSTAATTASTTTTVKSSTTSKPPHSKNVENGIFVRHPHPGFQEQDVSNGDDQQRNVGSVNFVPGSISSTEQLTNIKAISETTEVIPTNSPPTSTFAMDTATHCPPTQSRNLSWNWTPIQHIATQMCPSGSKGTAKWFCSFDSSHPQWVPPEADLSDCTSHWVRTLEDTINKNDLSVTSLATKLSRITKIKALYGGDIHKVTDIVNQLVTRMEALLEEFSDYRSRNQFVKDVLDSIHDSCNNLLEDFQRYSWLDLPPKQRNEAATHLMWALERTSILFSETNTANSDYNRMMSNIYIAAHTRVSKETHEGIELPLLVENSGNEVNNSEKGVVTAINSYLSSNRVYLPLQTLKQSEKESVTRITLVMYTKLDALFVPTADSVESSVVNEENVTTIVNSNVIGLTLNKESFPMNAKVRLTFRHTITVNVTNPKCVFWDVAKLKWSPNGCELLRWNLTHTTCECDHLTNFAVLMEIRGITAPLAREAAFRVLTLFGCSVAVFCLIFTLAILIFSKNLKGDRITIRTNLCLCLLIAELLFLFGISQTETIMLCRFIAFVLHYIILSAFLWMFFEGFQLYVMLIEVFESERSRLRYYYLFAYGIPLVIVAVCAYYDPYSYATARHCWLTTDNYFIHSFAVAILLSNLVFLTIALCVMCKHISSLSSVVKPNKDENKIKSIRVWLRGALALVFLLGMTWMSALLYLNQESHTTAYLFTIFNSFQALFIFTFHCFQNEKVRERYSRLMNSLQSKSNYLSSSSTDNSSSMNSAEKRKSVNQSDTTSISNQNSTQTQEPIIAPNSGSALTPTLRRVTTPSGAKYFITGKVDGAVPENEYGFRRVEEMRSRQKQRCRGHYCDHALRNTFVEHVYECIDDNPYTAKFAPSACSCRQDFNFRSQSESCIERDDRLHLEESANAFQEIKLPAIICDNSTVISKSNCKSVASPKHRQKYREDEKRNIVAKLNGRQVIIQTENHSLTGRFDVNI